MSEGGLPEGWRWTKLGNVARVYAGCAAPQGEQFFASEGEPFVRAADVGRDRRNSNLTVTQDCLSAKGSALRGIVRAMPGTILFPKSGAAVGTNGRAMLGVPAAFVSHLMAVEPGPALDRRWAFHWLTTTDMTRHSDNEGYPSVRQSVAAQLPIPLPSLLDQQRIASAIDAAMAEAEAIARATEAQAGDLDRLEFRIFEDAFPVRPLALDQAEDAPEGWTWRPLTSVARLESGHTPSRRHPEWWGGETPWIALSDIRAMDGKLALATRENINDGGLANSSARLLPTGTVCLCRDVSVGFVTVMGRAMATSQHFVNWVCGPSLNFWFLVYALMASRSWLRSLSHGALLQTIYMPTLKALRICLPEPHRQAEIVDHIERCRVELRNARNAVAEQKMAVDALPTAILSAAFSGQL